MDNRLKENFLRAYSNLPEKSREEIIVLVDDRTFSWNSAYFEIKNGTKTGEKILNNLRELELI